jgi:hypothetical protein
MEVEHNSLILNCGWHIVLLWTEYSMKKGSFSTMEKPDKYYLNQEIKEINSNVMFLVSKSDMN